MKQVDGILIIDKPVGMTSHDVVARVRRVLRTKRVGHTGTLDPFATGVMVLLIGGATRLAQFIDKDEKEYEALVQFGFETDTGDVTGSRIGDRGLRIEEIAGKLKLVQWDAVLQEFRGEILQTPPMYSAKKIDGKKLYELARQGLEVEREPVKVVIRELELLPSAIHDQQSAIRMRVACSAGTYIRTLGEEIGREVGLGAHLTELRRTRAGRFELRDAIALDDFEKLDDPGQRLRPISEAVKHLPEIALSQERVDKTKNGLSTRAELDGLTDSSAVRMLDENLQLVAIGIYDGENKIVKPKIVLI